MSHNIPASSEMNVKNIHGIDVYGIGIDGETRCSHWRSPLDIIAIKFKCCGEWFSCFECHTEIAGHEAAVWPGSDFGLRAVVCGSCGHQLTIEDYLDCGFKCTSCNAQFNPGCAGHYHLYFERS